MDSLEECPRCEELVPKQLLEEHVQNGCKPVASTSSNIVARDGQTPRTSLKRKASSNGFATYGPPKVDSTQNVKRSKALSAVEAAKPLAERVRPQVIDDVIGQTHLLKKGALLRNLIDRDAVGSLILWGPPGTGKTTLARVVAKHTNASFKEISATHTSSQELRKAFEDAGNLLKLTGRKTILFVDECQRLAKNVQELFLPVIESGTIVCLLATTENPSFRLQNALLSRCRVFVLEKLTPTECKRVLQRALSMISDLEDSITNVDDDLLEFLAAAADGDARVALSTLDLALKSGDSVSKEVLRESLLKAHLQYDRTGDNHYNTISALHKSIRGSDANAALYWLARMLEGGEDPLYVARRMIRMAAEDIGNADPAALPLAVAAYQSAQLIGMPECDCILAQCAVYLAEAKKSIRVYAAYNTVKAIVKTEQAYPVPLHIRNAPTGLMRKLDYGKGYLYEPDYAHPVHQEFLPPELSSRTFLQDDDSMLGKQVDLKNLEVWERLHGPWQGRSRLEQLRDNKAMC